MFLSCDRTVTQLLSDLLYFLANQENTGADPLELEVSKPDRERQKLLREQNILKQVSCILPTFQVSDFLFLCFFFNKFAYNKYEWLVRAMQAMCRGK